VLLPKYKTFLDRYKVYPPINISPNTPEYEVYKNDIMKSLNRSVTIYASSKSRLKQVHKECERLESAEQVPSHDLLSARHHASIAVTDPQARVEAINDQNRDPHTVWRYRG
jgi:hypothetical protein